MIVLTIFLSALGLIALAAIVYGQRGKSSDSILGRPLHFEFVWRIAQ